MRSPSGKVQTTVVGSGSVGNNKPTSPVSSKIALLRMQHQQILASINNNNNSNVHNSLPNNNIINNPNLRNKNASPLRSNNTSRNITTTTNVVASPSSNSNDNFRPNNFDLPSQSPSRRSQNLIITNTKATNNYKQNFSSSSSSYQQQDPREVELLLEIKRLEENLVKEKLRGEWAHRRIVALESVHNANAEDPRATLFRMEKRLEKTKQQPQKRSFLMNDGYDDYGNKIETTSNSNSYASIERSRRNFSPSSRQSYAGQSFEMSPRERIVANAGVVPSTRELHTDVSDRVARAEAQGRRIQDQIAEATLLRDTSERAHRDKVFALRRLRDQSRDKKLALEAQLRVAQGAVADDDELSDKQYKRYAARLETAREESFRRHEANLRALTERSDARCKMIQRETDELVASMRTLLAEKQRQCQEASVQENSSFATATNLGARVEEVEQAGVDIVKLTKKLDLMRIEQREVENETRQIVEEIRKAHFDILEREGKIQANGPTMEQKLRSQQNKTDALLMSVRTLQERIAVLSKRRRIDQNSSSSSSSSLFASPGDAKDTQYRQRRDEERSIYFLDKKLEELNKVTYATKIEVHDKEQELAKLSNNYNHLHERLIEVGLESEMLEARIGQLRHASAVHRATQELRAATGSSVPLTGTGAAGSLFMSTTSTVQRR